MEPVIDYEKMKRDRRRLERQGIGAVVVAVPVALIAWHTGMSLWQVVSLSLMTVWGLVLIFYD